MSKAVEISTPARCEKPLDVFADNEIVEEAGRIEFGQAVPGKREDGCKEHSADPRQLAKSSPSFTDEHPGQDRDCRENNGHGTFCEHSNGQAGKKSVTPIGPMTVARYTSVKRDHAERRAEHHDHVGHHKRRGTEKEG